MKKQGIVYIVGAGPGDLGLITVRGCELLKQCDVVVYDHLVSQELLNYVSDKCQKIYVGKQAGCHSMKQEDINNILICNALKGFTVVRLKGGDPFVFGRGGEEVIALSDSNIQWEVVSGVTSAISALSSAGIPITHRSVSRSFHVMTGHTAELQNNNSDLPPDFEHFAQLSGTLVFVMGLKNLNKIVDGLIKAGKKPTTPAAVIENGTLPQQRTIRGSLEDIVYKVNEQKIKSPAIIVVGEVVAYNFKNNILSNTQVSIVGTKSFSIKLINRLEALGINATNIYELQIKSYENQQPMVDIYNNLKNYNWIVFTSANAVRLFFSGLINTKNDYRTLGHLKFAVVGEGTMAELYNYGFKADYVPPQYEVSVLAKGLCQVVDNKDKLLIPRASKGSDILLKILCETQIDYTCINLYDIEPPICEPSISFLQNSQYLIFASSSGVDLFFDKIESQELKQFSKLKIVCIGQITAQTLKSKGVNPDIVAKNYSISGIVEAIYNDLKG